MAKCNFEVIRDLHSNKPILSGRSLTLPTFRNARFLRDLWRVNSGARHPKVTEIKVIRWNSVTLYKIILRYFIDLFICLST